MANKNVQFHVDVKGLEITSGLYEIASAVDGFPSYIVYRTPFTGNSFRADLPTGQSEYFVLTVLVTGYTCNGIAYAVTDVPVNMMAAFYLPTADTTVQITPESSVASIYTFARMVTVGSDGWLGINGTARNMKIAYGMKQNLYLTEGGIGQMISNSPNRFETNSYPMFNSLCNLFYYSLTDENFYSRFLACVPGSRNFLQALRYLLNDPFTGAADIYKLLESKPEVYTDSLTTMNVPHNQKAPRNWTLTLKSNVSGSKNFIPSGAAFVVFDADDNAWIANNFRAGSGDSGTHCPVYRYDATPAPFSPVQGGGLLGVAFGAAVHPDKEYISFGNFGWGSEYNNPQEGSISRFYKDGTPVTPSNGFTRGLSRVQGMQYDTAGNLWMASVGCQDPFAPAPVGEYPFKSEPSAVVVYRAQSDQTQAPTAENTLVCDEFPVKKTYDSEAVLTRTPYLKIFDVWPDNRGNAYVSCIGNYDSENPENCALSAVYKVALENNKLLVKNSWYSDYEANLSGQTGYESLRQVTSYVDTDGDEVVVVVGVTSSRATVLYADSLTFKAYYNVNTYAPWGVKIDRAKTVFLANFGHEKGEPAGNNTLDLQGPFGVTMLRNPSNPGSAQLLTVPTGGDEVMLANGHPLYGTQTRPGEPVLLIRGEPTFTPVRMKSYQPIMRLTSTNIDGAGNLWCMNNWKPSALVDVASNPGGDGVVIFLGIAEPE